MADYVAGITVQHRAEAVAGAVNPQISAIFDFIKAELGN